MKPIYLIAKSCDLFYMFKNVFHLLIITTFEGVGTETFHEFNFSLDLLKEHIQNGRHVG